MHYLSLKCVERNSKLSSLVSMDWDISNRHVSNVYCVSNMNRVKNRYHSLKIFENKTNLFVFTTIVTWKALNDIDWYKTRICNILFWLLQEHFWYKIKKTVCLSKFRQSKWSSEKSIETYLFLYYIPNGKNAFVCQVWKR